jgi:hypothetical protein
MMLWFSRTAKSLLASSREEAPAHSFVYTMYCKNLYTCAVLGALLQALLLVLAPIHRVNGEEEGAPPEACATMTPQHDFDPQLLSSAPFKTEIPAGVIISMVEFQLIVLI